MLVADDVHDYLGINALIDLGVYQIVGRNAFVGIWLEADKSFLISRYKCGPEPWIHYEYHWDIGASINALSPSGTAKPVAFIESCRFPLKKTMYSEDEVTLLAYLDNLEENHPIIPGHNSLRIRKKSAIKFYEKLRGKF